eukprot:CAMPEP_0173270664 /NCGR_PEP_ID=MMETSP1143-20121109/373_1 /TAXON_ID=483371 /ORGANISM="non described non described, Strain CCMP2298" /LENGTH=41 /DNA_ID= /DNA_START= /DNA_END= /DNA_ORIENTATION=
MTSMQQWTEAFDARLKTKAYEQFGTQVMLHSLLFSDRRITQ